MTSLTEAPAASIPGAEGHTDGAGATRPVQTRSERPWSLDPADFGVPTGREVDWKHAPLALLAPLFDDVPAPAPVWTTDAVVDQPDPARESGFRPEDVVSAIAAKRAGTRRIVVDGELDRPLVIGIVGGGVRSVDHIVVEVTPHSRGTVVIDHTGAGHYAQNVEIVVGDAAALTLISLQRWDDGAVHAAAHQARVGRDALLTHAVVSFGGAVARVNPSIDLVGAGSEARLWGLAFADAGQHLESQVYLHHRGPHTKGDVLYKGALQGAGARTVWIGDVLIGPDAVGTDSYEANRNLVLTDGARADSIPNLEIETGDIVGAGHASATGRFDDEQLFYLQARGIGEAEARRLVVLGFLSEIVQRLGIPALQDELTAAIERELREGETR